MVICGASFAGLACADALGSARDVVMVDQREVGEGQTSACALPLSTVRFLGLEAHVEERHDDCFVWVRERRHRFRLPEPYCTIGYRGFCEELAARSGAQLRLGRIAGRKDREVLLAGGERLAGRFLVDAAGWRRHLGRGGALATDAPGLSYGAEEHVAYPDVAHVAGLHIYVRRDMVGRGYGWNFPSGDHARAGVGSYVRTALQPGMGVLRERDAMGTPRDRHGGVIPHLLREPVEDGVLFVGDAGGHCLPLTAEGIRCAITFGVAAGRLIGRALDGEIADDEARSRYGALVLEHRGHFRRLLAFQRAFPALHPRVLGAATRFFEVSGIGAAFTKRYISRIRPDALAL